MLIKSIFAGFGGQGVLMMGYSLAHAAMNQGFFVTHLPAYGAEMRGGTANCTVCISDEEIASPIASEPDYLVALNAPSLVTFQNKVGSGGTIFVNSSIISTPPARKDVKVRLVPCSEIAEKAGNPRAVNLAMLGAFMAETGIVRPESFYLSLEAIMTGRKKDMLAANRAAFDAGYAYKE